MGPGPPVQFPSLLALLRAACVALEQPRFPPSGGQSPTAPLASDPAPQRVLILGPKAAWRGTLGCSEGLGGGQVRGGSLLGAGQGQVQCGRAGREHSGENKVFWQDGHPLQNLGSKGQQGCSQARRGPRSLQVSLGSPAAPPPPPQEGPWRPWWSAGRDTTFVTKQGQQGRCSCSSLNTEGCRPCSQLAEGTPSNPGQRHLGTTVRGGGGNQG